MRADLVEVLRCPVCGGGLVLVERTARCARNHAYDLARQGYLNLLTGASKGIEGDSVEMIAARAAFLAAGHFAAIRDALVARATGSGLVVEVGAGTAYYLAEVTAPQPSQPAAGPPGEATRLDGPPPQPAEPVGGSPGDGGRRGIALDVSRFAARRAAKVAPRIGAVVCDAWRELPLLDHSADLVLNVFAPRNAREMARILAPNGTLLVVTPNQSHLGDLVAALDLLKVDDAKDRRLHNTLAGVFTHDSSVHIERTLRLDHTAVEQLVTMTPSARHLTPATIRTRVSALPSPLEVQLSVTLTTWHPA